MGIEKTILGVATAPARMWLAGVGAGLNLANAAVDVAKRAVGDPAGASGSRAMASMLGIDEVALARANRLAGLLDDDMPLGRAIAQDGALDRFLRPGGVVDLLTSPGGLLDRLTVEGGVMQRALQPGGLADQIIAEDGPVARVLAEDGLADRILAEDGPVARVLAEGGLADRLLAHLKLLDNDHGGFAVDRLEHSLQTATRAHRAGQDEEYVVCALMHDIGDLMGPANHAEIGAVIMKPYVSEANHWMM